MITRLTINRFRLFEEKTFHFGKFVTVLAGRNATGKSILLGMVANAFELKAKEGRPIIGGSFKAIFSEILKGSREFDQTGSNLYKIEFEHEGEADYRDFRITWQKDRFRVIPYRIHDGKRTDSRMRLPVIYLGLSRLYPIGEARDESLKIKHTKFSSNEEKEWFESEYKRVLTIHDEIEDISEYSINTSDKRGVGINSEEYDFRANSSGQDNVGQILLAILSFKRQHDDDLENWRGGLLVIDEIDATLHPAAQTRLFELLVKQGREIGLQTVFTTHSMSLLDDVLEKTAHNSNDEDQSDSIECYYLTKANRKLAVTRNPTPDQVVMDLRVISINQLKRSRIGVLSEDAEAIWLAKQLLDNNRMANRFDFIESSFGCNQLIDLYIHDYSYMKNRIIVFDGDVSQRDLDGIPSQLYKSGKNIVRLPGNCRPELFIWEYLVQADIDHAIWDAGFEYGFTYDQVVSNGPQTAVYSGFTEDRERFKQWFKDNKTIFEHINIVGFWVSDNEQEFHSFIRNMYIAFNAVAERNFIPKLQADFGE
ncbi:MAG: AAA family ATPase [Coriobacteriia bacterium]|nr:AAA family ATPase [Coriobacteriia bacterium]